MENLKMHTPDLADKNFKKLAALFPNAVTETKDENGNVVRAIDADVLRQEISATVVEGPQERYQFTWPDKKKSVVLANQPIAKTLRLDREKSVGKDGTPGYIDTENIYIERDNLDALKLLQETYLGKVKMIYIDPPYNTGNDFIYEDDFSQNTDEYLGNSGQFDEEGNRLVQNTESNGRFHTDWLNMIYPRLRLAKDLLTDDGVIFISIDDNELNSLISICNEIFGTSNYQGTFVINASPSAIDYGCMAKMHEYAVMYSKNELYVKTFMLAEENKKFDYQDVSGPFSIYPLYNGNVAFNPETRPNLYYPFYVNPNNNLQDDFFEIDLFPHDGWIEIYPVISKKDGIQHVWRWGKEKAKQNLNTEIVGYRNKDGEWRIVQKYRSNLKMIRSLLLDQSFSSRRGTSEVQELFGQKVFSFPKPTNLIKQFLLTGMDKNDIFIDFFSGSASSIDALMQLNAIDRGKRKYICIQLPEKIEVKSIAYKAGYKTICEIGEERIRLAGKKIKEESPLTTTDLDIGFRVFKVDSTNMEDVYYRPADYNQGQMELFADNIKPDRTPEDLLFQVMLDLGILLSSDIQETEIAGKKVFSVADGYLIACFDKDVTEETVKAIAQKQPVYAVFRDSSMASDSVATNFEQIFETYSPRTQRKVL